jgi:hypothetical protein
MKTLSLLFVGVCIALFATACGDNAAETNPDDSKLSSGEVQSIARDAYLYGFPLVMNLKTLYEYTVDTESPNYKGPVNEVVCEARLYTPADTTIVTPNSDTPYCMFWMDLRSEPVVMTVPEIESGRYYGVQLIDLFTHNFAYIGTRTNNNEAGSYLLTGPGWAGETPEGISEVISSETNLIFSIIRTQLFNPADIERVAEIQAQYSLRPLSEYLGQNPAQPTPSINIPAWETGAETTIAAFEYLDAALDLVDVHPDDAEIVASMARIGLGTSGAFDSTAMEPSDLSALEKGVQQAQSDVQDFLAEHSSDPLVSARIFGTREFLIESATELGQSSPNLQRAVAALMGLYGNSGEEAIYPGYLSDRDGQPLNAAQSDYELRFSAGELPPVDAFWSLSMYDGMTQLFIDNPLDRYLISSAMLDDFVLEEDGSLIIHLQHQSPGAAREANWLPAPDGPYYVILRLYLPEQRVLEGEWNAPALSKAR